MALQSVVNEKLAFGVPGSFYDDSPRRVAPYAITGDTAAYIARAFTLNSTDKTLVECGGSGDFAGIAVNSKEYPISGITASLGLAKGAIAQICDMGHIVVACDNAVAIGNVCYFKATTGELHAAATGQTIEGYTEIPGTKFVFVAGASAGDPVVLEIK